MGGFTKEGGQEAPPPGFAGVNGVKGVHPLGLLDLMRFIEDSDGPRCAFGALAFQKR